MDRRQSFPNRIRSCLGVIPQIDRNHHHGPENNLQLKAGYICADRAPPNNFSCSRADHTFWPIFGVSTHRPLIANGGRRTALADKFHSGSEPKVGVATCAKFFPRSGHMSFVVAIVGLGASPNRHQRFEFSWIPSWDRNEAKPTWSRWQAVT